MPVVALPPYARLRDYEIAVRLAGGEPRRLEIGRDDPADVVRHVDALLLPGGGDVDPARYGEAPHPTFDPPEPGRDAFEIELAQRAREVDLPLLAICRGIQVLNVARGGSLVQDIPSQIETTLTHRRREPPDVIAHDVLIAGGSLLARLLSDGQEADRVGAVAAAEPADRRVQVNSRHHQSIKRLGEGLVVTATAADDVIEAVEDRSMRFCVGVQWHPENFHRTGEFRSLFEALVRAARHRSRG